MCSTIIYDFLTNDIIVLWRCCCRRRGRSLNPLKSEIWSCWVVSYSSVKSIKERAARAECTVRAVQMFFFVSNQ